MSIKTFIASSLEREEQDSSTPQSKGIEPNPDQNVGPAEGPGASGPSGSTGASSSLEYDTELHSWVCAGCACLCDDISLFLKKGKIVRTLNLCETGWKRLASISDPDSTQPLSPSLLAERIVKAAGILRDHRPALVLGADVLDEAAIRASRRLARSLDGFWLPWAFEGVQRFYDLVKRYGWAFALLDEVRDRADLVLFWRADPLEAHHRHLSRYSFFARGRFTERGNLDRNLAAVGTDQTIMEPLCQQFFAIAPEQDAALVNRLMDPLSGQTVEHRDLPILVRALERSSYVALFTDPEKIREDALEALFQWSMKINMEDRGQRMVILPLWGAGSNTEGFCRISLEMNGTAWGNDFSKGVHEPIIGTLDWDSLAKRVKSVLLIDPGEDGAERLKLPEPFSQMPHVVVSPHKRSLSHEAEAFIPAALPGIESDGIFFRSDGLPLKAGRIEALKPKGYPEAREILNRLIKETSA